MVAFEVRLDSGAVKVSAGIAVGPVAAHVETQALPAHDPVNPGEGHVELLLYADPGKVRVDVGEGLIEIGWASRR